MDTARPQGRLPRSAAVRAALLITWLGLLLDACVLGPQSPDENGWGLMAELFRLRGNPALIAVFYVVGILIALHASLLALEPRASRPHPAWAIVPAFALGSFILLPYYALRRSGDARPPHWLGHRALRLVLLFEFTAAVTYAIGWGDWPAYWTALRTSNLAHVMTLDGVVLTILLTRIHRRRTGT